MSNTTIKPKIDWFSFTDVQDQADYLGKNSSGFKVVSENCTDLGVVEIIYTYDSWHFNATVLIVPILDSSYVQIMHI